jgi:hypothetical protein
MRRLAFALLAAAVLAGCQEKLTAPGDCPALCPGGELDLRDTIVNPEPGGDDTYPDVGGYIERGIGEALLVSNGLPAADARGIIRFVSRPDTVPVGEDFEPYVIDSVALSVGIAARDTLATGLQLLLYRIPVALADSTTSFAEIESLLLPENLIRAVEVPDTLHTGVLRTVFSGAELARVAIPAADTGVLAMALALSAPQATGVRVGSIAGGALVPRFVTYVSVDAEDEDEAEQTISRAASFTSWVAASEPAIDPARLTIGGAPSKRALIRFPFPDGLRDTAQIVRATLELTPVETIIGLSSDPAVLQVRAILADFGAKSPPISVSSVPAGIGVLEVPIDTVLSVDVTSIVRAWQAADSIPTAMLLDVQPEAATFTRLVLESTASGGAAAQPRLRITYARPIDFEAP